MNTAFLKVTVNYFLLTGADLFGRCTYNVNFLEDYVRVFITHSTLGTTREAPRVNRERNLTGEPDCTAAATGSQLGARTTSVLTFYIHRP